MTWTIPAPAKLVTQGDKYQVTHMQLAFGLTNPQQSQLKLDPGHLPDAKDLEHIQLELG